MRDEESYPFVDSSFHFVSFLNDKKIVTLVYADRFSTYHIYHCLGVYPQEIYLDPCI